MTLALGRVAGLPDWVRRRIEGDLARNTIRTGRIQSAYLEIASALAAENLDFVVLKGFTHCPLFTDEPRYRVQYDLDLLLSREAALRARDILLTLQYEPLSGYDRFPIDHLPAMLRKTGWDWRGDYYDPEIPVSVDLHFRLWDPSTERFAVRGLDAFWERRIERRFCPADLLGYACLHLLRHLLRGDPRPSQVYEIARFLHVHAADAEFWREWRGLHDESLRRVQAICFRLAVEWFHCAFAPEAQEEVNRLGANIERWFEQYALASLESESFPKKQELWLHMSLVESTRDRLAVLWRRLLPLSLPGQVDAVTIPDEQLTWRLRVRRSWRYLLYTSSRAAYHAGVLVPVLWHGVKWWWSGKGIGKGFLTFWGAASLYDFGMFVFFLLYNLYLLDRGFQESFLGLVTAALSAGSIAGTLPSGAIAQKVGLRRAMIGCFLAVSVISGLRALAESRELLLALAFLGGFASSMWAVAISPAVAQLTKDENRPFGFSLLFSSGVAMGVVGGLAGGRLPGLMARVNAAHAKQWSLLFGCAIVALAAWPASKLKLEAGPKREARVFPRNPFLWRFLPAIAIWSVATGAFNPFFNAYFAKGLHMPVERIGAVFSFAQLVQAGAMLVAPLAFRRWGLSAGIAGMQLAAASGLAALAAGPSAAFAGVIYATGTAFQWMSEPGMYSLLMGSVKPTERNGASALNFLIIFSMQAIAAAIAGQAITKFGYSAVLAGAAVSGMLAALLFGVLLRGDDIDEKVQH